MKKLKTILEMFFTMLKIGLFTFGGGYAMIAIMENEFVAKKKWLEENEFLDMVAIAESTPGPIAINSSTYIGYKRGGVIGAILTSIAVCIPSFVIIFLISLFFDRFMEIKYVGYAFRGIQACVVYLILSAGIKMLKKIKLNVLSTLVFSAVLILSVCFTLFSVKFSSVFFVLISGVCGLIFYFLESVKNKGEKK